MSLPGETEQPRLSNRSLTRRSLLDEEERAERDSAIQRRFAWGEFLGRFAWDHFATLTFADAVTRCAAEAEFRERYARRLARVAQRPIAWALVVEGGGNSHLHLHALLSGTAALPIDQLTRAWKRGHSRIAVYDPQRRGADYLAKTLGWYGDNCELSRRRPPRLSVNARVR